MPYHGAYYQMSTNRNAQKEYLARISRCLDFLNRNLGHDLSLNSLAKAACFSAFHFHRIFLNLVGETPNEYVRRLRLEKSANMLINFPGRSVTDIALDCGFSGSAVFARAFRAYFGVSARGWRAREHVKQDQTARSPAKKQAAPYDVRTAVEIKTFPFYLIAYVQCREGYNRSIGRAWNTLFRWAYPENLVTENTLMIGIPLDNPDITPRKKCRYNACITVPPQVRAGGEVCTGHIEAGKYAVHHFKGKESLIKDAYSYIYGTWLPQSGWEPKDSPALEIYSGFRKQTTLTYDICLPVKPLSY
jgi:AraC family transcriptional regulator